MASSGKNVLYYGDNLDVLQKKVDPETVDLVYLDPPFNSNRSYNVLFAERHGKNHAQAQIQAFDDTWSWSTETEKVYLDLISGQVPGDVADALQAMHELVGRNDVLAYLVMMAPRLVALHGVLKPTGSVYLHCDPTASHYLKVLMDATFGPKFFRNEIVWKRFSAKNDPKRYGRSHDVVLFYTRGSQYTWHPQYGPFEEDYVDENYRYVEEDTGRRYRLSDLTANKPGGDVDYEWHGMRPYKGRHWAYSKENLDQFLAEGRIVFRKTGMPVYKRYLDEQPGVPLQDVWTDIRLHAGSKERLGYPTQKPLELLERIIKASSEPGDVVLDPFCGCGTTVEAAHKLGRRWIGIDITYIAIDLIRRRLQGRFGEDVEFDIDGIPRDFDGAKVLAETKPFDFQRWAVSLIDGQPNEKQAGDRGVDGVARFLIGSQFVDAKKAATKHTVGRILVSVKGGQQLNPGFVRDLAGTVNTEGAEMGVLITLYPPTRGMIDAANKAGLYEWPMSKQKFPKIQIITVRQLLKGERPKLPPALTPYLAATRSVPESDQLTLA